MKVSVVADILKANDTIARENRALFDRHGLTVFNLMSSPGSGKTCLLERTIPALKGEFHIGVIEGDIQGSLDAERLARYEIPIVQINTGGDCHLDANMIRNALGSLKLAGLDLLFIENVGNLVCPAEFKVGEDAKVMILSTPEGDDKPLKYPLMFLESSVLLINKIDLLPYLDTDLGRLKRAALGINPHLVIFEVSCTTGEGLEAWFDWVRGRVRSKLAANR